MTTQGKQAKSSALMCVAALALAAGLGACSSEEPSRYDAVKADLTPNMDTLYERPADIDNSVALTFDENGRMFIQDLGRAFYWDRPSRLTREPIPRP